MTLRGDAGSHPEPSYPVPGPGQEEYADAARAAPEGMAARLAAVRADALREAGQLVRDHLFGQTDAAKVADFLDSRAARVAAALASEDTDPAPNPVPSGHFDSGLTDREEATLVAGARSTPPTDPAPEGDREALLDIVRQIEDGTIVMDAEGQLTGYVVPIDEWRGHRAALVRAAGFRRATDPGAGETVTEWGVRLTKRPDGFMLRSQYYEGTATGGVYRAQGEDHAKACAASPTAGGVVVSRERTHIPDRVTEWQPVDPEGRDHE